ncbi:hypothetical protein LSTR_LSTR005083 [Laodelphax striatellus]|uniref:DUF155 domain-containing protein n=1 Tax=Laodelphax striatellus TaxID=195883 RepID=A0A482WUR4_LAOST|nr:hypothetical protein LSTR_LSTR005083 [Laodelphax striatellus]
MFNSGRLCSTFFLYSSTTFPSRGNNAKCFKGYIGRIFHHLSGEVVPVSNVVQRSCNRKVLQHSCYLQTSVKSSFLQVRNIHIDKSPMNSTLQAMKKRVPRKKKLELDSEEHKPVGSHHVLAFATAEEYNLESLREGIIQENLYTPSDLDVFGRSDVLCAEAKYNVTDEPRQIYFFKEGAVVLWNMSIDECQSVLNSIKRYEQSSYDSKLVLSEQEIMNYTYASSGEKSSLIDGSIVLAFEESKVQTALDRYTFSNAIALSVKLGVWEGLLEEYISSIEQVTIDLKLGNKMKISRKEALKKTGELFALRHTINLSSDVLDVPDFYWDREELETLYLKMCNYFSISRRSKVVNEKINHCLELVDLISSHLNDNHHIRLEWMIIILIMVEVGIEVVHYMDR